MAKRKPFKQLTAFRPNQFDAKRPKMYLQEDPLHKELFNCQNILLAGAGGGFDIYSGIPLYFLLRRLNKNVHLANLSFSSLYDKDAQLTEHCFQVTKGTAGSDSYFPERTLCRWFAEKENSDVSVYSFPQCGVVPLRAAYNKLIDELDLDAIVLVDGGTDSLMRGDEVGLGTPSEDIASMAAVNGSNVKTKVLSCLGFGVDRFHGVCHAQYLESVAALAQEGAFLGSFSVLPQTTEGMKYIDLVKYSSTQTPSRPSIVNTSIAAAVEGKFGNFHTTERTRGSKLWISPLMSIYWSFQLAAVVQRNLYAEKLEATESLLDVSTVIQEFRSSIQAKQWDPIPD